jgi:hypothetical protein
MLEKCAAQGEDRMLATADIWYQRREILKTKRNLLFKEYVIHPNDFHFASEIKTIDDEIADYTHMIEQECRAAS